MQQQTKLTSAQPKKQVSLHVPAMIMHEWDNIFGSPMSAESIEAIRSKVKDRVAERNMKPVNQIVWG